MKPKALDLFCGAGGASMGLHLAGFDVTGIDRKPQPRYPFAFVLGDALEADLSGYDLIWASPPCQKYSIAALPERRRGKVYPDLMNATRAKLQASGKLYIIENVPGAPMRADAILCGSMFGLNLVRHRLFETNYPGLILTPPHASIHNCRSPVCGGGTPSWVRRRVKKMYKTRTVFTSQEKRDSLGIDWTNREELSQAIPPAYSEFLGRKMMNFLIHGS